MANMHDEFQNYLAKIRLTATKRDNLKGSRDANRKRIREYFRDTLKREVPKFYGQGSYLMHTNLNPINSGEYDLDDGVYLQGLGTDQTEWPSSETVHGWIVDAVKNATSEPPKDKACCVRVRYAADYHIDLPIYALNASNVPMIFKKGEELSESDPRAFTQWFNKQVSDKGSQLKPLVRYLKGWRDYKGGGAKIASGLALTILASHQFCQLNRDDEAFVETVKSMITHLEVGGRIYKPVTPGEDLTANWTDAQRQNFIDALKNLHDRGQDALDEDERSVASGIWRNQFGDRFPKVEADDKSNGCVSEGAIKTPSEIFLPAQPARSA